MSENYRGNHKSLTLDINYLGQFSFKSTTYFKMNTKELLSFLAIKLREFCRQNESKLANRRLFQKISKNS